MLLFVQIEASLHGMNKKHYVGYPYTQRGDKILVYPEQVPQNSRVELPAVCEYCGKNAPTTAFSYWQFKNGVTKKYCCEKNVCREKHRELRMLMTNQKHPDEKIQQLCEEKGLIFVSKFKKGDFWYAKCNCKHHEEEPIKVAYKNLQSKKKKYHCKKCYSESRSGMGNPSYDRNKTDLERKNHGLFPGRKKWRKQLLEKDRCCIACGSTNNLEGHHLISTRNVMLKADCDNGVILCRECHRGKEGFHTQYGKKDQFKPSHFIDFLEKCNHDIDDEVIDIIKRRIIILENKIAKLHLNSH